MKPSKPDQKQEVLLGLEFDKLTHWERFVLNQNLARMEKLLYPDTVPEADNDSAEIWRGERRRHHRLEIARLDMKVKLDLSTVRGGIYRDVLLLNLSPLGCCVQMPLHSRLEPGSRIPRLVIPLPDEELVLRARVVHVGKCD